MGGNTKATGLPLAHLGMWIPEDENHLSPVDSDPKATAATIQAPKFKSPWAQSQELGRLAMFVAFLVAFGPDRTQREKVRAYHGRQVALRTMFTAGAFSVAVDTHRAQREQVRV